MSTSVSVTGSTAPAVAVTVTNRSVQADVIYGASNSFTTIAVSGQDSVVVDSGTDTLTLVAGTGTTITTNSSTDTVTFASASSASPSYATPYTFDASAVSFNHTVRMTVTGAITINVPTNGTAGQRIRYHLLASGGSRTVTLGSGIQAPTGSAFSGVIASGSTRVLEIELHGSQWFVTKNLEFVP